ncbi:MAG: ribbon-helix-helix domain-containing protein [Patescibacteria group bacterium]
MRTTQTMTISLPPAMVQEFEAIRKTKSFTRSELIRQALREYFYSQFPVYTPTKAEKKAIEEGRREIANGKFITWEKLRRELELKNRSKSRKTS